MKAPPRISDTEWEVMRIIWNRYPITANEIIEQLVAKDPSWHPKTARTLLNRLVRKKALDYEARGRKYVYSPLVNEDLSISTASESFLERVFGGGLKPMLSYFVEKQRLSKQELEELRQLLKDAPARENNEPNESGRKKWKT
jgi:BlaI family penicillinase repressor